MTDLPTPDPPPPVPPGLSLADVSPDALCSTGIRPLLMTGMLVQAIRQHFAARDQIEDPALKHLVWDPSPGSPIVVESITRWRPDASGTRPAIVVRRGAFTPESRGINDEFQGFYDPGGDAHHAVFEHGTHTLFAIAGEAGEAELLGAEVYRDLIQFGPVLRSYLQLQRFKAALCDQLHRVEEAQGSYAVPVTVAYAFETSWRLIPNAPRLKRIDVRAVIDGMA